jgi:hypothetical protein
LDPETKEIITDYSSPNMPFYQLAKGCLVDQLVGQYMSHICGLGYLAPKEHVKTSLESILKYNKRESMENHFNNMRSYALGTESALLMASWPNGRPKIPFPYFSEVMTGFEYAALVGMIYEGMETEGLQGIQNIRDRYDGAKRSPFDEAECGHHYARAMASWASIIALTGFEYSGLSNTMKFKVNNGTWFWSNGYAYGTVVVNNSDISLKVIKGKLQLKHFILGDQKHDFKKDVILMDGEQVDFSLL